jgi:hypothetical protein
MTVIRLIYLGCGGIEFRRLGEVVAMQANCGIDWHRECTKGQNAMIGNFGNFLAVVTEFDLVRAEKS